MDKVVGDFTKECIQLGNEHQNLCSTSPGMKDHKYSKLISASKQSVSDKNDK